MSRYVQQSIRIISYLPVLLLLVIDFGSFHIRTIHSYIPPIFRRHTTPSINIMQRLSPWMLVSNKDNTEVALDNYNSVDDKENDRKETRSPYIAIVTEPDACDTDERYEATMKALYHAISTNYVNLISIRLSRNRTTGIAAKDTHLNSDEIQFQSRYIRMIQQLREWSDDKSSVTATTSIHRSERQLFHVVVSSGPYMELGLRHCADGVHFKEMHRTQIPSVREFYNKLRLQQEEDADSLNNVNRTAALYRNPRLLVGASVHSIISALEANQLYQPDYMFVGTCYMTQSHPDKVNVEGPRLPSQVYDAILQPSKRLEQPSRSVISRPLILGIGGIDENNCGTVVKPDRSISTNATTTCVSTGTTYGICDGIAVIRSVLQSIDPAQSVTRMHHGMQNAYDLSL